MQEFLSSISSILNVLFIVSAVTFGVSFAVKILLIKTVKNINEESYKNFDTITDFETKSNLLFAIDSIKKRYVLHNEEVAKFKKVTKQNKIRRIFKIKEKELPIVSDNLKDIFLSLFNDVSYKIDGSGGYLNFSKNELFSMIRSLLDRFEKILNASDVIWLKTVKIPFFIEAVKIYGSVEKFTSKPSVILVTYILNFFLAITRFFSPVGATKKLAGTIVDDSFSSLLASTVISVVGKEWAVLCYQKAISRDEMNNK